MADRVLIEGTDAIDYTNLTKDHRELNFLVLNRTTTDTISNGTTPVTVTMVEPDGGTDYRNSSCYISSLTQGDAALKIENCYMGITGTYEIGNHDLFLGRGLQPINSSSYCIKAMRGATSNKTNGLKYRLRVESGSYESVGFWVGAYGPNGNSVSGITVYWHNVNTIWGNDYDRAMSNNQGVIVTGAFSCGRGGRFKRDTDDSITLNLLIKSGQYTRYSTPNDGNGLKSCYFADGGMKHVGLRYIKVLGGLFTNFAAGMCTVKNTASPPVTVSYRLKGGTWNGCVYGSASEDPSDGGSCMVWTGGTIGGWIAGGCNGMNKGVGKGITNGTSYLYVGGTSHVGDGNGNTYKINSSYGGSVYGAGSGNLSGADVGRMTYGSNVVVSDSAVIEGNVFGGGNSGYTLGKANVIIAGGKIGGTVNNQKAGNVFGGSNQNQAAGEYANVLVVGGRIEGGVYGGCNESGTLNYDANVIVKGGIIGTSSAPGRVCGGGYGNNTVVQGDVNVTIGEIPSGSNPSANKDVVDRLTIYGDVYGGSALGYTNVTPTISSKVVTSSTPSGKNTTLNMYSGTVDGSVYWGALGSTTAPATIGSNTQDIDIYGGKVTGGVYGGSNINASMTASTLPQLGVTIHDTYTPTASGEYAIGNVFGGGNGETAADSGQPGAHDTNTNGTFVTIEKGSVGNVFGGGNAATVKKTTVEINTCDAVVGKTFGGCNAAAVEGDVTTDIWGGTIGDVFAGGNGVVYTDASNPGVAANVGGNALVNVYGGTIQRAFAGTNNQGTITGSQTVNVEPKAKVSGDTPCTQFITELYEGGNYATGKAGTLTLDCAAKVGDLYGGANQADITTPITLNITKGQISRVFGGNNTSGNIPYPIIVNINKDAACDAFSVDSVFGGGNLADYTAPMATHNYPQVNILAGNVTGDVYGGGNMAAVTGNPVVTMTGGSAARLFAGGNGDTISSKAADIKGTAQVIVSGGSVSIGVYGGCNALGTIKKDTVGDVVSGGNTVVAVNGGRIGTSSVKANIHGGGYGAMTNVEGSVDVTVNDTTAAHTLALYADVYGGSAFGQVNGTAVNTTDTTRVTLTKGTVHGDIYGGGLGNASTAAKVWEPVKVTMDGDTINGNIFGCNNLNGAPQDTVLVNINGGTVTGNVYGGGNLAAASVSPVVTMNGGSAVQVFGGGLGTTAVITGNPSVTIEEKTAGTMTVTDVFGGGDAAAVTGNPVVDLKAGTVTRVFGGGNQAAVTGTTTVNEIGAVVTNIYAGGNGDTTSNKAADINGTAQVIVSGGSVSAGVYGGCNALGTINKVSGANGNTIVTINGGSIGTSTTKASIHGGGHGERTNVEGEVNVTVNDTTAAHTLALYADVYGGSALGHVNGASGNTTDTTRVTLTKGTVNGDIYGGGLGRKADNTATPAVTAVEAKVWGPVKVTVTAGQATNVFGCNNLNGAPQDSVFVNINGGTVTGNVYGGGNEASYSGTPVVNINDCSVNIGSVYGGGNAAATGGTNSTIWGGTIGNAFGGGNGTVHAADVNGNSSLTIHGGTIKNVFAGSNTSGTITGTMALNIDWQAKAGCSQCAQHIDSIYGGGNKAASNGATITIGCGSGYLGNVFGGAKAANINGKLVLNIKGGQIDNVFGGNDQSGEITDSIIVNINNGDCASAYIGNVYGGGNYAPFKHNTQVNLITGKVGYMEHGVLKGGNVFGGGYGAPATVSGNTEINLCSDPVNHPDSLFKVLGSIYGGGDLAAVQGNTTINLTKGTAANVFGGGNKAAIKDSVKTTTIHEGNTTIKMNGTNVTIGNIYGGGNEAGIDGNADLQIISGTVNDSIYGGCNTTGTIAGNTLVTLTGGTMRSVFGGGYGQVTDVDGTVDVKIGTVISGSPTGTATVTGDVYGGSALGNVNKDATDSTHVTLISGTVTGNIYGGGLGDSVTLAQVLGPVKVTVSGGTLTGNVFGCNNKNGAPQSTVTVLVDSLYTGATFKGNIYGGGNQAAYAGNPSVAVKAGKIVGNVFGGGYGNSAVVTGDTHVSVSGGSTVTGSVFGGGDAADLRGGTTVKITGAQTRVNGDVFGGGNNAAVSGPTNVQVGGV